MQHDGRHVGLVALLVAALAGMSAGSTAAADSGRVCPHPDVAYAPSWSPDGRTIAFTGVYWNGRRKLGADLRCVYTVDPAGGRLRVLHAAAWLPAWSPDGTRIAFATWKSGTLTVARRDGSGARPLVKNAVFASWSRDGRTITYTKVKHGGVPVVGTRGIYTVAAAGGRPLLLRAPGGEAKWSPDGRRIVYVTTKGRVEAISVMNADGTRPVRLFTARTGGGLAPAWAPDSRHILFVRQALSGHDDTMWVLDTARRTKHKIATVPDAAVEAAWSPDGRTIAFARLYNSAAQLYLIEANGRHQRRIT